MTLTTEKQLEMLRSMQTIRRFEERASDDYQAGAIYGVVHCYIGEESGRRRGVLGIKQGRPDHQHSPRSRALSRQGCRFESDDG